MRFKILRIPEDYQLSLKVNKFVSTILKTKLFINIFKNNQKAITRTFIWLFYPCMATVLAKAFISGREETLGCLLQ